MKNRQHNDQKKKNKWTNNDLQEEFEDTKGVIRNHKSTDNTMVKFNFRNEELGN
jgi:hypothetical protein